MFTTGMLLKLAWVDEVLLMAGSFTDETVEVFALGPGHPLVQGPKVSHRHIGEGQVMQITVGTELRRQGAERIAALKLRGQTASQWR